MRLGGYTEQKYWGEDGWRWRKFRNVKWPTFWIPDGPQGSHWFKLRTTFEAVTMPWDWPVVANVYEAKAFCAWKSEREGVLLRLLTEAEHHLMRQALDPSDVFNSSLLHGSETSVDAFLAKPDGPADVFGNLWQWCEDDFHPLDGFRVHPFYDDFSTPCFDGKHNMIMGGSFVSTGDEASPWARFHFRPHFFQHAGFRMVEGTPTTAMHVQDDPREKKSNEDGIGAMVASLIEKYLGDLPVGSPMGADFDPHTEHIRSDYVSPFAVSATLPVQETPVREIFEGLFRDMAPGPQKPGHPRYFAYLAGSTDPLAIWAQAAALALNPYAAHHTMAAFCVEMEREVIGWFVSLFGLPPSSQGLLTTGSSLALLSAVNAARFARLASGEEQRARIYLSEEGHHAVAKAAVMAGFPSSSIAFIECRDHRMDTEALERQIAIDERQGFRPFVVVGTAGTTTVGRVDNLSQIAAIAAKHNLWFHVDAAYGGAFQLIKSGQQVLLGIEGADSINFDFHKSFSMPYGTGCLLVRDGNTLRTPYGSSGSYMPLAGGVFSDPAELGPELSRDFRALRVWLPLKARGIGHYRRQLEEKKSFAQALYERLKKNGGLTVLPPELTVVALHCGNKTRATLQAVNARGRVFLSGCTLAGQDFIRICVLSHLASWADVELCAQEIETVLSEGGCSTCQEGSY